MTPARAEDFGSFDICLNVIKERKNSLLIVDFRLTVLDWCAKSVREELQGQTHRKFNPACGRRRGIPRERLIESCRASTSALFSGFGAIRSLHFADIAWNSHTQLCFPTYNGKSEI